MPDRAVGSSRSLRVALTAPIVAGILCGGCARALDGQGFATLRPTSGSTVATSSQSEPSCGSGSIHPIGAPFCYALPVGFSDYSDLSAYGSGWLYRSLISTDAHDLITVVAGDLRQDSATVSARQRLEWFDSQRLVEGKLGVAIASALTPTTVDGAIARSQDVSFDDGIRMQSITVLRGRTIVNLRCEWLRHPDAVHAACNEVLNSIQIRSL
jgi:hypothetical protein